MSNGFSFSLREFIRRFFERFKAPSPQESNATTKIILTIWQKRLLNPHWWDHIEGFDAISIKCVDGDSFYSMRDALSMGSIVLDKGLELHAWGFHYCLNRKDTVEEAKAAANACKKMGASAYHWNAEKHWAGGEDPVGCGKVFAQTFKGLLPDVELYANCFSSHATVDLLLFMDRYEPMLYGTRRQTIENKFESKLGGDDIPDDKKCAMVGTGRKDANNPKRAWGYLNPSKGRTTPMGLAQLIVKHKPYSVNFFRAGIADGEDIMVIKNSINPTLSEQVTTIKDALLNGGVS